MPKLITQLDLTRSILWEFEDVRDKETCELLTQLFVWFVEGKVYTITDTNITSQMKRIIDNLNKHREISRAITKAQVVKKERTDDLIYDHEG